MAVWPRKPIPQALTGAAASPALKPLPLGRSARRSRGAALLTGDPQPGRPKPWTERILLVLAVLLLLTVVLPPLFDLERYRPRVEASLSRSLGRQVTMRALTLHLLPAPALLLTDVVVQENSSFGAEPVLRAPSVTAQLRLSSLVRGHLEVSQVDLSDASLNLVRNAEGRWNVGSMLLQASHLPNAPTGQLHPGPTPRFPYIAITDSRVNLKQGVEKLPYSLENTSLSMWLDEPEIWQIRLEGQPVRTDIELGLSDTGTLRLDGSLHRATALGAMPLALHGEWSNAPLGQASRLLLGSDRGWRGDLHATADVSGELDNLAIQTHVQIANLHRQEFTPPEPFDVDATCRGAYSRAASTLSDLSCRWPVGGGELLLTGNLAAGSPDGVASDAAETQSTLALTVKQLPASFLVAAVGLARSDFAPVFHLEGALNGMLFYNAHTAAAPLYAGVLEAPHLSLAAPGLAKPLEVTGVRLAATTPAPSGVSMLELTADPLDLGGPSPVDVTGQLTGQGFLLHASGSASLTRLEELGRTTRLLPPAVTWLAPDGTAEFDVTKSAGWQQGEAGANSAATEGWLRLHDAMYKPPFLSDAVALPSAQATFLPGEISWNVPAAVFHQIPLQVSADYPLECAGPQACVTHFHAKALALDAGALLGALNGPAANQPLFDQLFNRPGSAHWPMLDGTVHAETLTVGRLALHNADAALSITNGKTTLRSLDAQALGGSLHCEGLMTMAGDAPRYDLTATLTRASASAAGAFFHENWGSGTLTVSSQLQLSGLAPEALAASAAGHFHAQWSRGGLGAQTPLAHFALWTADGLIENEALTITQGELSTSAHTQLPVTGSVGFDRKLSLSLAQGDAAVSVGGTLAHPAR